MHRIMRVGAAMLALLVTANVAVAQGGGGGGGGRGGRGGAGQITLLLTNITLSEAVTAKVDTLRIAFMEAGVKLRADMGMPARGGGGGGGTPPDSATMAKYNAANTVLTDKFRADVRALLTPDQQKTFDENLKALPPPGGRRGGGE